MELLKNGMVIFTTDSNAAAILHIMQACAQFAWYTIRKGNKELNTNTNQVHNDMQAVNMIINFMEV